MEDAHIAQLSLPKHPGAGLFGVFDGHNGPDAARWVAANLASFVDDVKAFGEAELKVFSCPLIASSSLLSHCCYLDLPHSHRSCLLKSTRYQRQSWLHRRICHFAEP